MTTPSLVTGLRCDDCGHEVDPWRPATLCPQCGGLLEYRYDAARIGAAVRTAGAHRGNGSGLWRWRALLPVPAEVAPVTLGEGDTPLVPAGRLADRFGLPRLLIKNDGLMPTGSFKDRGFALAVSAARGFGLRAGFTYSSGNAGASFAAYAARAGLAATVFVEAAANAAKVASISLHGAAVYRLHYDSSAEIFDALDTLAGHGAYSFVNFVNPIRHEAMKTYAYEICEQLDWQAPDVMVHPVGTGGGLYGAWQGFRELHASGVIGHVPRMIGVQPAACAPLVDAMDNERNETTVIGDAGATIAQSIAGDSTIHGGRRLLRALRESGGSALGVAEEDIAAAVVDLAGVGLSAEPSAAVSLAAVSLARDRGLVGADDTVVAVLTGNALKQPDAVRALAPQPVGDVGADAREWAAVLGEAGGDGAVRA